MEKQYKYYIIYKTTCKVNNKIYVGQHKTNDINDSYIGSGSLIREDIAKFGKHMFSREILFECKDSKELDEREKEIVDEDFIKRDDTYNVQIGGCGFDYTLGYKTFKDRMDKNPEYAKRIQNIIKEKRELTLERRKKDPDLYEEWREKVSLGLQKRYAIDPRKGIKHTEESKKKIGMANSFFIGEKNSQYGTEWITNGFQNVKIKKGTLIPEGFKKGRTLKK